MELWTTEHKQQLIPSLLVMLVIAFVLRLLLGKKDLKIRMIPFNILACVIVLLEIGKQIVSFEGGYDLYHLPFHFCSMFIFALPAMAFYKGKHRQAVSAFTTTICTATFLLMLIYPSLIYGSWNITNFFKTYLDFHTVAFHNIVMMEFLLILFLDLHTPAKKVDIKAVTWFIIAFCVISASMAHILKTNFANYYTCNIAPLEQIRLNLQAVLGVVVTQLIYITIVSILTVLFVWMAYGLYKLARRLFNSKKSVPASA